MKSNWIQLKAGGELGQKGSEGGIIVRDEEYVEGQELPWKRIAT
jgi:hypothetical protein